MENSGIEWTHHTNNLWIGCEEVSSGCDNCYAHTLAKRWKKDAWGDSPRIATKSWAVNIFRFNKKANQAGEKHRVFTGSMMDIFEKTRPVVDTKGTPIGTTKEIRDEYFLHAHHTNNLLHLLLTKRPSNIIKMIPDHWAIDPPDNIMFGASISDVATAKNVLTHMKQVNGRKFISLEPQLEYIDFSEPQMNHLLKEAEIEWLIQGGESGHKRRPFDVDWARKTHPIIRGMGIKYFFKQVDKVIPVPEDLMIREVPL